MRGTRSISPNLNLLAYLIAHRDARSSNFLMPTDPSNPRVFSIDNGIAFGGVLYNFFTWHFDEIRTGGLPRQSIDRLRLRFSARPREIRRARTVGGG